MLQEDYCRKADNKIVRVFIKMKKILLITIVCLTACLVTIGGEKKWDNVGSWVYQLCDYKNGKLILGVEYAKNPKSIADAYKKQREIGFVPYVSVEKLNVVLFF